MAEDEEEAQIRQEFDFHRRKHDELAKMATKARREAGAHHQVMDGLVRAYPFLRDEYRKIMEGDRPHGVGQDAAIRSALTAELGTGTAHKPKGIDALRLTLGSHPGAYHTVAEVHDMMVREDLAPNTPMGARVVRNILTRATEQGVTAKRRSGGRVEYAWVSGVVLHGGPHANSVMREIADSAHGQLESAAHGGRFAGGASG